MWWTWELLGLYDDMIGHQAMKRLFRPKLGRQKPVPLQFTSHHSVLLSPYVCSFLIRGSFKPCTFSFSFLIFCFKKIGYIYISRVIIGNLANHDFLSQKSKQKIIAFRTKLIP
jgi:hypothetical protein